MDSELPEHWCKESAAATGLSAPRHLGDGPAARRRLEEGDQTVEAIALATRFGTAESMRRAFHIRLGVSPTEYRRTFGVSPRHRLEPLVS